MDSPTEHFQYAPVKYFQFIQQKCDSLENNKIRREYMIIGQNGSDRTKQHTEHLWNLYKTKGLDLTTLYKLRTLMNRTGDKRVKVINKSINNFIIKVSAKTLKVL